MSDRRMVTMTYYLDVLSSWCFLVEPTWTDLKEQYKDDVSFEWKIAFMDSGSVAADRASCDWFYRRSGTVMRSLYMLSSEWMEPAHDGELITPNRVALAAKLLGNSEVRHALAEAAFKKGINIRNLAKALQIAADRSDLDIQRLSAVSLSSEVSELLESDRREFDELKVNQRPTFLIVDEIGDRAVLSGLTARRPFAETIDAMISDCVAYRSFQSHFGLAPGL